MIYEGYILGSTILVGNSNLADITRGKIIKYTPEKKLIETSEEEILIPEKPTRMSHIEIVESKRKYQVYTFVFAAGNTIKMEVTFITESRPTRAATVFGRRQTYR